MKNVLQNINTASFGQICKCRRNSWPRISVLLCGVLCVVAAGSFLVTNVSADDKEAPPVIKAIAPLGIADGMTVQLSIRGFRLGDITGLKFPDLKTAPVFKIKSQGVAPAINRASKDKIGDTQVDVELLLPVGTPAGDTTFIVVGPNGQSEPRKILVLDSRKAITEKEPNDGFSDAQGFKLEQTIAGVLSGSSSRDVYGFSGESGQRVKIEVQAAQLGSLLEPLVLIHDADGQLLMESAVGLGGYDPTLEITLIKAGRYFISIRDSKDAASPMHAYLIRVRGQ